MLRVVFGLWSRTFAICPIYILYVGSGIFIFKDLWSKVKNNTQHQHLTRRRWANCFSAVQQKRDNWKALMETQYLCLTCQCINYVSFFDIFFSLTLLKFCVIFSFNNSFWTMYRSYFCFRLLLALLFLFFL